MEERDLSGVERELRTYLSSQLDRLPVRSTPRFSSPPRAWMRTAAFVPATMLILLIAVAAGLGLADWRAHRTPSDESQVATAGVPGPLALGGGAPSLGFGLVSTSANTLLLRNETTTSAPMTITNALPQVAVSPNGHEIAYWLALPDPQTGKPSIYQLTRADIIVNGSAPAIGSPNGALMRAPSGEVPGPVIWSSDGTGLIANTHTPTLRGPVVGIQPTPPVHATWFAIDAASGKATELAPGFTGVVSTVYAWDRQRDLITGSGFNAGETTFTALRGGRITNNAFPRGSMIGAADAYGRSIVLLSIGACADGTTRCPLAEIRDQATFVTIATVPLGERTTDYPDVIFRPRSQDLIVQIPLPNGNARVELWSDLGRGAHRVLASYTTTGRFTARRETILPRADGSAVFLLKFDDSAGGRWFGELVSLAVRSGLDPQRTPFEIRTGGNPLASVVLDPAFAGAMETRANTSAPSKAPSVVGVPSATQGSRTGPISTAEIVARLTNAGMPSRISPPAPSRLLLYNATDQDLIAVDQPAIKGFVVYRYPTVAAAAAAFQLEPVKDPTRSTISYVARPYFVGLGDTLVVFATDDEATAQRVIAALVNP